ncbi:MAG: branched-chain amino acid ABC transporter permease, partial [Stellaceae bacterium]
MRSAIAILIILAALATVPWLVHSDFWLNFAILSLYYGFLGQSWNILGGFGGQFSFGQATFFGTGAYAAAVLQLRFGINPWICLVLASLAGGAVGAFVGGLSFRYGLRGSYFALVTLAFAEVFEILADSLGFTGAGVGLQIPLHVGAVNFQFPTKTGFYFAILAMTALGLGVVWWIEHSRFGARLVAVRESEDAARALGVDVFRTKLWAMILSAALMALGGTFYLQYFLYIDPSIAYGPAVSIAALLAPIVGGLGTALGPLLGAVALQSVNEVAQSTMGAVAGLNLVFYGVILVLMIGLMPNGLFGP